MQQGDPEYTIQYRYQPSQDGPERLACARDLILELILTEFEDKEPASEALADVVSVP